MRVAVLKLSGVESVNISLERAITDVQLKPGNSITLDQLRTIIKNNGFTTRETTVTVVGMLIERAGQPTLEVTGTNTEMIVAADPKQPAIFKQVQERLRTKPGTPARLTGTVESTADSRDRLKVQAMSEP